MPIIGGGRLSGKVSGVNVGVLNMQTDAVGSTPGNNYSVLRASREVRGGVLPELTAYTLDITTPH